MAARHTNADLFHQWEEAEERAARWEAIAREEKRERNREVKEVKAEIYAMMSELRTEMQGRIETLTAENTELKKKVALLEEDNARLKSIINNDSNNSSKPPSTDQKPRKTKKANEYSNREKAERKRGGQPGHAGKTLTKQDAEEMIRSGQAEHRVVEVGKKKWNSKRYVSKYICDTEIKAVVIEYRYYPDKKGKMNIPVEHRSGVSYGNGIRAMATALYGIGVVSNDRIHEIINAMTNGALKISSGKIYEMIRGFSERIRPEIESFCTTLVNQKVLRTDATTAINNGRQNWIRNVSCESTVVYFGSEKKNLEHLRRIEPLSGFAGTLVHDHETAMYHFGTSHAECNVHLMRYLRKNDEDTGNDWSTQMRTLLSEMNRARKERIAAQKTFKDEERAAYEARYDAIIQLGRTQNQTTKPKWAKKDEASLLNRLEKYKENHLLFLRDFDVPFDNNMSERDLRKCKNRQKMSGGFRSSDGMHMFCRILSFVETAKRRGINAFSAIRAALEARCFVRG